MSKELQFAKKIVKKAGTMALQDWKQPLRVSSKKSAFEIVTKTDRKIEKYLMRSIQKKYPKHSILGEELGEQKAKSAFTWVIDPIDGTLNFARKIPYFGISVGLLKNNQPYLGVVYNPVSQELFYAQQNQGSYLNQKKNKISKIKQLKDAHISTGFSHLHDRSFAKSIDPFKKILCEAQAVKRFGSAALDICNIASGKLDGFWMYNGKIWDFAASLCILAEAGGQYHYVEKKDHRIHVVAGNPAIYRQLKQKLRRKI